MLHMFLARSATTALSAILGGAGVFCLIESYWLPSLVIQAAILLGLAAAIVCFSRH